MRPPPSILFVCLGNICRSPAAEAVLRDRAEGWRVDSAGTGDWHVGAPPYPPMQRAAKARGYDLSALRARQVTRADFGRFDRVIAMDGENRAALRAMGGTGIALLTDWGPDGAEAVPDPYFTGDFEGCLDLIETCIDGLLADLTPSASP